VFLADELVQRAGAHPGSQGRFALDLFSAGVVEKVHDCIVPEMVKNTSQQICRSW
jgi:hypothetical protein